MRLTKSQLWITGTALLCTVILLAGWFVLIAPKRAEAADLREQTANAASVNDQLELKVAQLKADFAELPQRKAELAAIRLAMPEDAQLAALTRDLQALANGSGVTLMAISPGVVTPMYTVAPPVAAAPAEGSEAADGEATPAPAPVADPNAGLSAIPVSIDVVGTFDRSEAFLKGLQSGMDRRYLVDGITATAETPSPATGGKPAVTNGDVTFTVTGRVFVLAPAAAAAPAVPAVGSTGANN